MYVGSAEGEHLGATPLTYETDPGDATLVVEHSGHETAEENVEVVSGETQKISVELTEQESSSETSVGAPRADGGTWKRWGWSTAGVGLFGLGTGVLYTILQKQAEGDVRSFDRGAEGATLQDLNDLKEQARSRHRTSLVAYSAGTALTAVGAGMLTYHFLSSGDDEGVSWRLQAGPGAGGGWAGVNVDF